MTTKPWVPYVNTIKDKSVVPIAHYADPTRRFDPLDPTHAPDESGDFVWADCGDGIAPAQPNDVHRMCPICEAKRTPTSVLVMCDATWGTRNGF